MIKRVLLRPFRSTVFWDWTAGFAIAVTANAWAREAVWTPIYWLMTAGLAYVIWANYVDRRRLRATIALLERDNRLAWSYYDAAFGSLHSAWLTVRSDGDSAGPAPEQQ